MQNIREKSKELLKTEIKFRGAAPYVYHPFYSKEDSKRLNLRTSKGIKSAEDIYIRRIDEANTPGEILLMVRSDFKLRWLASVKEYMSNKDFSKLLGEAWVDSSAPNAEIEPAVSVEWFEKANKSALMTWAEYRKYRDIPSRKKLYRGNGVKGGLSWTDDIDAAKVRGRLKIAYVPKERILAVFDRDFSENEYIVQSENLTIHYSNE